MFAELIYKHAREKFGKVCVDIIVIIDDVLVAIVILIYRSLILIPPSRLKQAAVDKDGLQQSFVTWSSH